ncbi:NAD(P)-binding domain-containing protein [Gryllotalpicola protaetiae]|uniref:NAD(P)-binding domain-containing protein n=1 Tax=Gryllotalpicola protaetiae TaxID=2419771 RepID=UPI001FE5B807|nr:NAD(P)-binding domain-containing protein [Gryllotalpicola protaetiae]
MRHLPTHTQVVVVGAGQAGLSVAYFLKRFQLEPGVDFVVVDRGPTTGGAWQHRWEALTLGSAHRVADLPGMDELGVSFATADHHRPAKDVVEEYYRAYEEHYGLNVFRPVEVMSVFNRGADLVVNARVPDEFDPDYREEVVTRLVVNASGTWRTPFVPYVPGIRDFAGEQFATNTYTSAEHFRGKSVVVVGGGTSAIGFLLELEGVADRLAWATRRPVEFNDDEKLSMEGGVRAVAEQDAAARAGKPLPSIVHGTGVAKTRRIAAGIERGVLVARPMFTRVERDGVRWPDGSFTRADAIIWATGFRPELRHLAPLRLHNIGGGVTVANGAVESDPRIFLAGYGPQASTIGASRAGRAVARQVIASL